MINYFEIKNETMDDLLNSKILLARDVLELKANLSGFIKQIFMVFHGLFSRDFTGSIEDKKIFEETYPYLSKLAKKEIGTDYISKIIEFLSKARDKFMHGFSYMNFDDAEMVKIVSKIDNYNPDCLYTKNNKITYAGFFAFLCCFSNDKMINYYLKSSRVNHKPHFGIKLVDKDAFTTDEYSSLTTGAVGMKDEILIRKPENTSDVITAIFGKFMDVICKDKNNNFSYDSGIRDDVCDFFISGSYKNNILIISKNSLFLDYFEKDYKLEIKDENAFISLCEQVPPFYLVAHLKKMGITEFNSNTLSKSDIDFITKYNKPKYYVDKNINTLFYPKSEADVRFVGQIISSTLLYMFINFEETVYGYFQLDSSEGYSKISKALKHIGISGELFKSLVAIRNFFAHQYIIGDYIYAFDKFYKVTIKFVFETLEDFVKELEEMNLEQVTERRNALEAEIRSAKSEEELQGMEEKINAINVRMEELRALEQRKQAVTELQTGEAKGKEIENNMEERSMKNKEIRNSEAYINAYAKYIKTEDDKEVRALLTQNAEDGTIAVPDMVVAAVQTAWDNEPILAEVKKTTMKGNVKIGFEISATGAVEHTEGGTAVTEETLVLGIATLTPISIKKWISISDEVLDMNGEAFLNYIYSELGYHIAKKCADEIIADILATDGTGSSTVPVQAKVSAAVGLATIAQAVANLSDEASNPVVIMNKLTYADFKAAQANANYGQDIFDGLEVIFNNTIEPYTSADSGDTYAIVGDLGRGVQANFPAGEEIEFKFDDKVLMTQDLVRVLGRMYCGHAVVAPKTFVQITKPASV